MVMLEYHGLKSVCYPRFIYRCSSQAQQCTMYSIVSLYLCYLDIHTLCRFIILRLLAAQSSWYSEQLVTQSAAFCLSATFPFSPLSSLSHFYAHYHHHHCYFTEITCLCSVPLQHYHITAEARRTRFDQVHSSSTTPPTVLRMTHMVVVRDLFMYSRGSKSESAILIFFKFNISVMTRTVVSILPLFHSSLCTVSSFLPREVQLDW